MKATRFFKTLPVLVLITTLFSIGCDDRRLEVCQGNAEFRDKEHAREMAELKQKDVDRVARVAQRYASATQKVVETALFRNGHPDMPQGTVKCTIGPETERTEEYLKLFPAEVKSLREEQMIYHALDWMFEENEEFKKLRVNPNSEIALPPEPPAPTVQSTNGTEIKS
ncbi:MAG: hypothetical protein ABIB04_03485 [Patescibacteria group bacterium]